MAWSNTVTERQDSLDIPKESVAETPATIVPPETKEPEERTLHILGSDLNFEIKTHCPDPRVALDRIEECIKNAYIFSVKEKKIGGNTDLRIVANRISSFWFE